MISSSLEEDGDRYEVLESEAPKLVQVFPRKQEWRVRTVLEVVEKAAELAELGDFVTFICGNNLMKEGTVRHLDCVELPTMVTAGQVLKSWSHHNPADRMVAVVKDSSYFQKGSMSAERLDQIAGRLAGRREDGRPPTFYAPHVVIENLQKECRLQEQLRLNLKANIDGKKPDQWPTAYEVNIAHPGLTMQFGIPPAGADIAWSGYVEQRRAAFRPGVQFAGVKASLPPL